MLNTCQTNAMELLESPCNVFLTGGAGSGKSFLIRHFLKKSSATIPVLASTGAAAILVGGRTFHSFFGLGILEGGVEKTVEKAVKNKRLLDRVRSSHTVIIDEISMIPGVAFQAAEKIARLARKKDRPWGGMRVIAVGDFSQLPPVTRSGEARDWAFLSETWRISAFLPAVLKTIVRTDDIDFLEVLNFVRSGIVNERVMKFLKERTSPPQDDFEGTRMFPLRRTTEEYNLKKLGKLTSAVVTFPTQYSGEAKAIESMKMNAPVPELIQLKKGALVMLRQNDPEGRWVNGSLATVLSLEAEELKVELLDNKYVAEIERATFHLLDANGERAASASNFPVTLAYATTIHKAQGTTLDRMMVDLANLWEPGHAYVALSRVRAPSGLFIEKWSPRSIMVDPAVTHFHQNLSSPE